MAENIVEQAKEEVKNDLITQANASAERLEKANTELKTLLEKQETILANERLGGRSLAGTPSLKKEESPKEYAQRIMRGGK